MSESVELFLIDAIMPLIKAMVDFPQDVAIRCSKTPSETYLLEIDSSANDRGKLIGRSGRNALALRHLITAIAAKTRVKVIVDIIDA